MSETDQGWIERFTLLNIGAILLGGGFAMAFINPHLEAGPIRTSTYFVFCLAAGILGFKMLSIVRAQGDGKANIFLIASTLFWLTFCVAALFIGYLVLTRAFGFSSHISPHIQTRISYFFITGSSIGALFSAIVFVMVPPTTVLGVRVSAWPLTIGAKTSGPAPRSLERSREP